MSDRNGVGANGTDMNRGNSPKNDKQKRHPPAMGNWRSKTGYYCADKPALIVPVGRYDFLEWNLGFF